MDDDARRRYTRRGALGLMGIGGLAVVSETIGFTTLRATRPITVDIVGDANSNALLEIEDSKGNPINGGEFNTPSVTIDISNNTGEKLDADNLVVDILATEVESESLSVVSNDNFNKTVNDVGATDTSTDIQNVDDSVKLTLNSSLADTEVVQFDLDTNNNGGLITVDITFVVEFTGETLKAPDRTVTINS